MFPFFDGLIPEGWLLEIAVNNWKLNQRDRFGLLSTHHYLPCFVRKDEFEKRIDKAKKWIKNLE